MVLIYYIIFIIILLNIFKFSCDILLKIKTSSMSFETKRDYYKFLVGFTSFVLIFVVLFRFMRIVFKRNDYFDLNPFLIADNLELLLKYKLLLAIIIITLFFIKKLVKAVIKLFCVKIIHYNFIKIYSWLNFFTTLEDKIVMFFPQIISSYMYFLLRHGFKLFVILTFFKGILINGNIFYVGFIPYYGLYYFIYNFCEFLRQFKSNFDFVMHFKCYTKKIKITYDCLFKLGEYRTYLILGYSQYEFYDAVDIIIKPFHKNSIYIEESRDFFFK